MRYIAWISATPDGADRSRHEAYGGQMREPELRYAWIVDAASECGLFTTSGMGISPVTWQEIEAWSDAVGRASMWLKKAVRVLSISYVKESHEAKNPACPSPLDVEIEQQRRTVASQLQRFIRSRS